MQEIDLESYHEFFQKTLKVREGFAGLRDPRPRPQIPAGVIAQAIVYGLSMGQRSLLSLDNVLSVSDLGEVLGFKRFPVCSDSLMAEVIKGMDPQQVREILYRQAEVLIRLGLKGSSGGEGLWACALDGSTMLGREVVVCYWVGCEPYVPLDWEPVLKGENETEAAKRLLPRVLKRFGWAIRVVVGDGLYTGWFFKICLAEGKEAVAKLREEDARGLKIVQAARQRRQQLQEYGVPAQEGVQEEEGCAYQLREVGEWAAFGLREKLRVIWSWQKELKGQKRKEEHWLLTTLKREKVPAVRIRGLGRSRWRIENNGFRETNQKMGRKHRYTKDEKGAQVMMGLMWVAHGGLQGYVLLKRQSDPHWRSPKHPVDFLMKLLLGSLLALKPKGKPDSEPMQGLLFSERTLRRLRLRPVASG